MEYIQKFIIDFIDILNQMSPYLMLGFIFAGILKVAFPQKFIDKYLGQNSNRSVINACLIGIPLPLCSCGVIPTGMSFYKSGASKGASVSFLISTPQTGIDSIMVTYSLLGLPFAIIRPIVAFITGVLGGILSNKFDELSSPEIVVNINDKAEDTCCNNKPIEKRKSTKHSIISMLRYAFIDFLQDIYKWLIIGLLMAATISTLLPSDFFASYVDNDFIGMLIMLVASVPLYICATSSVPIAAVLLMKGLSPGAALVFLMAGPATNIATITVMNKVMGKKTTLIYLASIIMGAIGFGLLIDNTLPREWFYILNSSHNMHTEHQHVGLPNYIEWFSSISLVLLIINAYWQKHRSKNKNIKNTPKTVVNKKLDFASIRMVQNKTIHINGMTCNHCKNSVEKHVGEIIGIDKAIVNLADKTLYIEGSNIQLNIIHKQIEDLGYSCIIEKINR